MSDNQEELTIAQALRKIKKIKGQLGEAQSRATTGVSYDQTKIPEFRFQESVDEMKSLSSSLVDLESKVAVANATATVKVEDKDVTLAFAIRSLQEIKGQIAFLKGLHLRSEVFKERDQEWDETANRYVMVAKDIVFVSDLSLKDRDKQVKDLQDKFEDLNNKVETANHRTVLK